MKLFTLPSFNWSDFMDENNKNKITNIVLMLIILILIIIIILLLFRGYNNGNNNFSNKEKVNIFEIKCDDNCDYEKYCNNNSLDTNNSDEETNKVNGIVDGNTNTEVDIDVFDDNKTWNNTADINIFKNSNYVVNGKIAPESTGIYQFIVKNSTSYNVKYNIEFEEINNYHINMKYKLKKNNDYIIEDWVSYSQLTQEKIKLNLNSDDTYYLEWKWFSSDNDNSIGENINSKYELSINIRAVQANA